MNWRVLTLFLGMVLCISKDIIAQGFVENALLFSRTQPGGSARIQAMGGAQIALGGDFSSALSNPAGLGMYNRSEATLSLGYSMNKIDSEHFGNKESDSKNQFHIPGISYVHHSPKAKGGFLGGSFGISMTRTNDFNSNISYSGRDFETSIIDYFIENAAGNEPDQLDKNFPVGLGYENFLLEDSSYFGGSPIRYFSVMGIYDDPEDIRRLNRKETIATNGAQYQWSFAYGANFNDKLFAGVSLGIATLRYSYSSVYVESDFTFDLDPNFNPLKNLQLQETIEIEGTGVNLTLGLVFRPIDNLQIGASFVTPTNYQITDTYFTRLSTSWNNYLYLNDQELDIILNDESHESNGPIISEYNIITPLKFSLGIAYFISTYGFLSGDVEFINYGKARYNSDIGSISFDPENTLINNVFNNTVNFRVGGEFRYDIYRFRAGYNAQSNPYSEQFDISSVRNTISTGIGIRVKKFFADLAWLGTKTNENIFPYVLQDGYAPIVDLTNRTNTFMLTLGVTF
jgi:hypothetical protein